MNFIQNEIVSRGRKVAAFCVERASLTCEIVLSRNWRFYEK